MHVGGQDRTFNLPCDYELWSYVGRGSFGCVYHYKDTDSNLDLAMKCIPTQDCGKSPDSSIVVIVRVLILSSVLDMF